MSAAPRNLLAIVSACAFVLCSTLTGPGQNAAATNRTIALSEAMPLVLREPGVRPLGGVSPTRQMTVTITMKVRHLGELDALLRRLSSPESPRYGRYLSQNEANRLFDPTLTDQQTVETWLRGYGLRITQTYANRLAVNGTGSAAEVERLLHASLRRYRATVYGKPTNFFAPTRAPRIPIDKAGIVLGVLGLDNIPPHSFQASNGIREGRVPYFPQDLADAYDVSALWKAGYNGAGQRIGITLWSPPPTDKTLRKWAYFTKANVPTRGNGRLIVHDVNGSNRNKDDGEGGMDVEFSSGLAPGAKVDFWLMKNANSPNDYDALNRAGTSKDSVITSSWGFCEDTTQNQTSYEEVFKANAVTGHNYFFSTGDNASYCDAGLGKQDYKFPDYPASSRYVTAVGGTTFDKRARNASSNDIWPGETAWVYAKKGDNSSGDCDRTPCPLGSGGGFSLDYKRPPWQPLSYTHHTMRGYPDVSALADPNTGVLVCDDTYCVKPTPDAAQGGTSLSSPLWAGIVADINEMLESETETSSIRTTTGFIDPTLYSLSAKPQEFLQLHDITKGNNGAYKTSVGWDPVTGLGTPDAYNLARDWLGQVIPYWQLKVSTASAGATTLTWETLRPVTGYNVFDESTQVNRVGSPIKSKTADFTYTTTHVFTSTPTIVPVYASTE